MSISRYEMRFMEWVFEISQNGTYQKNERTGIATKRIPHMIIAVDCKADCPILKAKETKWKSSVEEAFWIFRDGSNDIHDLRPKIWNEWADKDGIVQKTYGYQIKKFDQVNRVLNDLSKDPSTRRAVIDLWNNADLPEMAITPCVYTSTWNIMDGKLNVLVTSRSCDLLVGGVFNIFQYTVLNKLFAMHLGVEPGLLTFVAADAHIYENQFNACDKMLKQYQVLLTVGICKDSLNKSCITNKEFIEYVRKNAKTPIENPTNKYEVIQSARFIAVNTMIDEILQITPDFDFVKVYDCEPSIKIEKESSNFFDTTIDHISVENYHSMPFIKFPVAV